MEEMNSGTPEYAEESSMSLMEKLVSIISSPGKVFTAIAGGVTWRDWVYPLIVALVFSGAAGIVQAPYSLKVSKSIIEAQKAHFLNNDMPQQQKENIQKRFDKQLQKNEEKLTPPRVYYWSYIKALIGLVLSILLLSVLYYFGGNTILGGESSFQKVLAMVSLPQIITAIASVYTIVMVWLTHSATVPTSLAAILPYDMSQLMSLEKYQRALFTLLSQIDVFTLWRLTLFTIGFQIIFKVTRGKAIAVIFGYWVLWLIITTGATFIFAGFGG